MEMSNSDVKIEKSNLLQKYIYIYIYIYIKTTLHIIGKTELNQKLQPKQRKFS